MTRNDFDRATFIPSERAPSHGQLFDPGTDGPWRGSLNGEALGGAITVLAYGTDKIDDGPRLHVHPYDEMFIVTEGRARFFIGDATFDLCAGQVALGPAGIPHRFVNLGPGRLQTIDVHHSPSWIQTDLDS